MNLRSAHCCTIIALICLFSCKEEKSTLSVIEGKQIHITDSIVPIDSINKFIAPYRNRINEVLDSALAYTPMMITKEDGKYNTSAGNLMADIVLAQAGPVFTSRTQKNIDFAVLNHGGIRSIISPGAITARAAFEVMPFENSIVVVALNGKSVRDLVSFLIQANRPHPIAGLQIVIDNKNQLQSVDIQGTPFDEDRIYNVATSDYLLNGGDSMEFFKNAINITQTDYLIRNAMIDYFKDHDTIAPVIDDRFIKINE